MKKDEPYRQYIPGVALSLERNTEAVPKDGWFYIIKGGESIGRYRFLKQAQQEYTAIRDTLVERRPPQSTADAGTLAMDSYFSEKELYWSASHKYRRGGGKGGRGGL